MFDASMAKAREKWRNFRAVAAVTGDAAKELLGRARAIPSEWVHANRNEYDSMLRLKATSRLVAVGCCESVHARADLPASSPPVFHPVCSAAARGRRPPFKFGAASAY